MNEMASAERDIPIVPGKLADNVVFFARALRQAGLPVGPGAVLDALKAVAVAPFSSRDDFRVMLHAVLVKHHEHTVLFDQVFAIFWKRRGYLDQLIAALSPVAKPKPPQKQKAAAGATRVADALFKRQDERDTPPPSLDLDAKLTTSGEEILRGKDFAQMSVAEIAEAMARIARLRLPADEIRMRRLVPDRRGPRFGVRSAREASASNSPSGRRRSSGRRSSPSATFRARSAIIPASSCIFCMRCRRSAKSIPSCSGRGSPTSAGR